MNHRFVALDGFDYLLVTSQNFDSLRGQKLNYTIYLIQLSKLNMRKLRIHPILAYYG